MNILIVAALLAQASPTPADSQPTCLENLASLQAKLEANYAGYVLEIRPHHERYDAHLRRLRARAGRTTGDACFFVLRDLIDSLHDPHLFIYQHPRPDSTPVSRIRTDEARLRRYFDRSAGRLDPIEGIWTNGALRLGVIPDSQTRGFVGVVLTPDTSTWAPGDVRARFTRRTDGKYELELHTANRATRHDVAVVHKRVLLRTSPGLWTREYPIASIDSGLADLRDPHRPTWTMRNGTPVISIPSHDPGLKPALDSLIAAHRAELDGAEQIIVDLRGNEGGSSWMTNALKPYIVDSNPLPDPQPYSRAQMLSSEDQIRYASRMYGSDTLATIRRLLARMRANPGALVPLSDSLDDQRVPRDSAIYGPRRVGIIVDGGTVSASEVLVLEAKRSRRATVYGEPTEGALDYQSTSIVWFNPRERRWGLGYPTIAASAQLPAGGMRGKGIAPDVKVDLRSTRDVIGYVERALRTAKPLR
jgi:hypothetical protein